jgi:hypothetical protein
MDEFDEFDEFDIFDESVNISNIFKMLEDLKTKIKSLDSTIVKNNEKISKLENILTSRGFNYCDLCDLCNTNVSLHNCDHVSQVFNNLYKCSNQVPVCDDCSLRKINCNITHNMYLSDNNYQKY